VKSFDGIISSSWAPRVIPFAIYIFFIALSSLVDFLAPYISHFASFRDYSNYIFYPVKTVLVAAALIFFWSRYTEISFRIRMNDLIFSIAAGIIVFYLWINMDWPFATLGKTEPFNPNMVGDGNMAGLLTGVRLFGAAVIVPVMEELFWRSFLIRYVINPKFESVPVGTFTVTSFVITVLLFGTEHTLWLAGIMAGIIYNVILYRTRSVFCCILAHGITNLLLGIYVIKTGNWQFW